MLILDLSKIMPVVNINHLTIEIRNIFIKSEIDIEFISEGS